jgi:Na+-driven multidrug efflux pump
MSLFSRREALDESLKLRFVLPVVLENAFTIFIGLAVSQVVSTISGSALAAIGMATSVVAVPTGFLGMIGTGAGILVSRHVGAREYKEAAEATEQATLLSVVVTTVVMTACLLGRNPCCA